MTYTGQVTGRRPCRTCTSCTELMISKVAVGPMDNNAYLLRCRATGRAAAHRRGQRCSDAAGADRRRRHRLGRHHPPARRPLAGARGGRRRHRGAHLCRAATTPRASPCPRTCRWRTATRSGWAGSRSPPGIWSATRPASIALVYDDPHGHPHVFTGDCLFPGGVGNTDDDPEAFNSLMDGVETKVFDACPTRPGSTPATARTPPSAPSGPTSRSGAHAAGSHPKTQQKAHDRTGRRAFLSHGNCLSGVSCGRVPQTGQRTVLRLPAVNVADVAVQDWAAVHAAAGEPGAPKLRQADPELHHRHVEARIAELEEVAAVNATLSSHTAAPAPDRTRSGHRSVKRPAHSHSGDRLSAIRSPL